jgi:WD40 repeat protein
LEIWNWRDGSQKLFKECHSLVGGICFSPDGQYIAVRHAGDVLLWNVRTGKCVENLQGHYDQLTSVAFMPDGMGLVSVSKDMTVKSWDSSFLGSEPKALESSPAVRDLNAKSDKVCHFYSILAYGCITFLFLEPGSCLCCCLVR